MSRRPRILCIEDDERQLASLRLLLEHEGFEVACMDTISGARALLDVEAFDAVISDFVLPDGTAAVLFDERALDPHCTIVISAYEMVRVPRGVRVFGKPVEPRRLLGAVRHTLPATDR